MNHPEIQELVASLYEELDAARQAQVTAHLGACGGCRDRVASWRSVRRELARWEVWEPVMAGTRGRWVGMKWAAAALVLLAIGFAAARATIAQPDVAHVRAELARELRSEVRQ